MSRTCPSLAQQTSLSPPDKNSRPDLRPTSAVALNPELSAKIVHIKTLFVHSDFPQAHFSFGNISKAKDPNRKAEGCSQVNRGPHKVPQQREDTLWGIMAKASCYASRRTPRQHTFLGTSLNKYVPGSVLAQNDFMPQGFALFLRLRHSEKNAPPCGFVSVKLMVTEGCSP